MNHDYTFQFSYHSPYLGAFEASSVQAKRFGSRLYLKTIALASYSYSYEAVIYCNIGGWEDKGIRLSFPPRAARYARAQEIRGPADIFIVSVVK